MSITLYVVSCDVFSVYKIFINPHMTFLRKYDMCMLCDRTVLYQCTYVFLGGCYI